MSQYQQSSEDSKLQRQAIQSSNELKLQRANLWLSHSYKCRKLSCHCRRIKNCLLHGKNCAIRLKGGGCSICKQLWALFRYHSEHCRDAHCTISWCEKMKQRLLDPEKFKSNQKMISNCHESINAHLNQLQLKLPSIWHWHTVDDSISRKLILNRW